MAASFHVAGTDRHTCERSGLLNWNLLKVAPRMHQRRLEVVLQNAKGSLAGVYGQWLSVSDAVLS